MKDRLFNRHLTNIGTWKKIQKKKSIDDFVASKQPSFFLLKDYLRDRNQNKVEAMKKYQNKIISFFFV